MALPPVLRRLEDAPRPGVLDLGAPVASNVELYARHGARIAFADLYRFYEQQRSRYASAERFAELLPRTASHTDVIFAWDLFNYLSLEQIGWLGQGVGRTCAPGTIVLALVSCAGTVPARPSNHAIVDARRIRIDTQTEARSPSPDYSEQELLRSLPGVTVTSRFQLRTSMVEYMLTWG